jgi:hypothetical protein
MASGKIEFEWFPIDSLPVWKALDEDVKILGSGSWSIMDTH